MILKLLVLYICKVSKHGRFPGNQSDMLVLNGKYRFSQSTKDRVHYKVIGYLHTIH